jgi:hypothetical protein
MMATIHVSRTTPLAPACILSALTDFSDRRPQLWPNLDARYYVVHAQGDTWAEVTEGSSFAGGVWERVRYDWSEPGRVRLEVQDSNAFAVGSYWDYRVAPAEGGGSRVTLTVRRSGQSLKGRLLAGLLRLFGARIFAQDLDRTLAGLAQQRGQGGLAAGEVAS